MNCLETFGWSIKDSLKTYRRLIEALSKTYRKLFQDSSKTYRRLIGDSSKTHRLIEDLSKSYQRLIDLSKTHRRLIEDFSKSQQRLIEYLSKTQGRLVKPHRFNKSSKKVKYFCRNFRESILFAICWVVWLRHFILTFPNPVLKCFQLIMTCHDCSVVSRAI